VHLLVHFSTRVFTKHNGFVKTSITYSVPDILPGRIKGLFLGESTGRMPVQGKVRRVFDRKLGIKSIHGCMLFIGFLGIASKA